MSYVAVKPELIQWARMRSRLPMEELTKSFPKLEKWEKAEEQPTLRKLEAYAKKTLTPLGYFFLDQPPEDKLPIPDFRTVKDKQVTRPSPNLLDTVHSMQRRQEWLKEYLIEHGNEPLTFVGAIKKKNDINATAKRLRAILDFDEEWAHDLKGWHDALRELRNAIEEAGILVVINGVVGNNTHRPLDVDEFRGFVLIDEYAPLIFINGTDAHAAQMFTLAHEFVHILLGRSGVFNFEKLLPGGDEVEQFCNKVAAEFLVPAAVLRPFWGTLDLKKKPFQAIAHRFKVSPLVAARRALDLDLITKKEFFSFFNQYKEDTESKAQERKPGGDFYNNQNNRVGRWFARMVIHAAREGRLLYRDAYDLTGLYGATFDKYAKKLGVQV